MNERRTGLNHALFALLAIVQRELLKFGRQYGRLVSALVRPLLWLAVFAAGFRNVFGVAIVPPYDTYIPYDVYIAPGLVGMVLLFNGMQSSLAMVYDREMGLMRLLLTAPLPRWWILFAKLTATAVLSLAQARERFERDYLVGLLKLTDGNVADAARLADRNRTEFYRLLQKHDLTPGLFRGEPPVAE